MGKTLTERIKEPKQAANIILTGGGYAILYPADSHKPGLQADGQPVKVRKIVGKIKSYDENGKSVVRDITADEANEVLAGFLGSLGLR